MSDYTEFFLNRSGAVVQLECLEVTHPSFAEPYYIVRNATMGVTVTHEDSTTHEYEYVPVQIERGNTSDDLDQSISLTIGDMGDRLARDVDAVLTGAYSDVKPQVKYRIYRHDQLTAPLLTIKTLEVANMTRDNSGLCTFTAQAERLNSVKTGVVYTVERFPMLRGFL